jgi:hypothetical protein
MAFLTEPEEKVESTLSEEARRGVTSHQKKLVADFYKKSDYIRYNKHNAREINNSRAQSGAVDYFLGVHSHQPTNEPAKV